MSLPYLRIHLLCHLSLDQSTYSFLAGIFKKYMVWDLATFIVLKYFVWFSNLSRRITTSKSSVAEIPKSPSLVGTLISPSLVSHKAWASTVKHKRQFLSKRAIVCPGKPSGTTTWWVAGRVLVQKVYEETASLYSWPRDRACFLYRKVWSPWYGVETVSICYCFNPNFIPMLTVGKNWIVSAQ